MCLLVIIEFKRYHLLESFAKFSILDRNHKFYAVIQVSWHPVGAADIEFFAATVFKPEYTAVLEESSDKAPDRNVIADAGDAWYQDADAADNEFDLDTCSGSFIKLGDDFLIKKRIHLCNDSCIFSLQGKGYFTIDEFHAAFPKINRRYDKGIPDRRIRVTGQQVEECGCITSEVIIAGEDAKVRIQLGCRCIVVARRYMDIAADAVFFAADDKCTLGMCLEADKAVNNVSPGFFKTSRHKDVVGFIKAGLDFHKNCDLLAILCCFFKRLNNWA